MITGLPFPGREESIDHKSRGFWRSSDSTSAQSRANFRVALLQSCQWLVHLWYHCLAGSGAWGRGKGYCTVVTWMLRPTEGDSCHHTKSRISHVKTKWQWLLEDGFKTTNHFNSGNGLTHKTIASNNSSILVRKRIYVYLYFTDYLDQLLCVKTEAICKIGYLSSMRFYGKTKAIH